MENKYKLQLTRMLKQGALALGFICSTSVLFGQITFTVSNSDDSGVGSLRQHITSAEAVPGIDTIDVTGISDTITLQSALPHITEDLVIIGAGAGNTVINCDSLYRGFFVESGIVSISDLTIYNGLAAGESTSSGGGGAGMGGAIYIDSGIVTLQNIVFQKNTAIGGDAGVIGGPVGGAGPFATGGAEGPFSGTLGGTGGAGGYGSGGGKGGFGNVQGGAGGPGGFGAGGGSGSVGTFAGGNGGSGGMFGGNGKSEGTGANNPIGGGGAGLGGAVFIRGGSLTMRACAFTDNHAILGTTQVGAGAGNGQGKGGAIFNDAGTVNVSTLTFSNNDATDADTTTSDNDSIYGILQYITIVNTTLDTTLCFGDSIIINGNVYSSTVSGATEIYVSPSQDSILTINLTVLNEKTGMMNDSIDVGESIDINGTTYDENNLTGTETFTNVGPYGCDSVVSVNIAVRPEVVIDGIQDLTSTEVTIFPNPTTGQFEIRSNKTKQNLTFKMVDVMGRIVLTENITSTSTFIDVSHFIKGVYIVQIAGETTRLILK